MTFRTSLDTLNTLEIEKEIPKERDVYQFDEGTEDSGVLGIGVTGREEERPSSTPTGVRRKNRRGTIVT